MWPYEDIFQERVLYIGVAELRSHQQLIWCHHINFSTNVLFSPLSYSAKIYMNTFVENIQLFYFYFFITEWSGSPVISFFGVNTESSCLDLKFTTWVDCWFGWDLISPLGKVRRRVVEWTPRQTFSYFQTFFVWALLLMVHTWNSCPLRSNLFRLQCTCTV